MLLILLLPFILVALLSLTPDPKLNAEFCRAEYLQCQRNVTDEDKPY